MVEELLGNEELMIAILRNQNRTAEINEFLQRNLTEVPPTVPEDPADEVFKSAEIKKRPKHKEDDDDDYQRYVEYMQSKKASYEQAVKNAKEAEQQSSSKKKKRFGPKNPKDKEDSVRYDPRMVKRGQRSPTNFKEAGTEFQELID